MNDNPSIFQILVYVSALIVIIVAIFQLIGYIKRKRKHRPFVDSSYYNNEFNYLKFTIVTNVDFALKIEKVYIKLGKFKKKRLGISSGLPPNNKAHSDRLSKRFDIKVKPIIEKDSFLIHLPEDINPDKHTFIIHTNECKIKYYFKVMILGIKGLTKS